MKVYFHIGPHKTGTTSIQHYLLDRFGAARPSASVWYPSPEGMGPGHALMASQSRVATKGDGVNVIARTVETALQAGVKSLLLSSENFSLADSDELAAYRNAFAGTEIVLIATMNSLSNRVPSWWQELVKHRFAGKLEESAETIFKNPGFRASLMSEFADALNPTIIGVIYSSVGEDANVLIERFCSAINVVYNEGKDINRRHNASLGLVEVELLRNLNQLLAEYAPNMSMEDYIESRNMLYRQFISPAWRSRCPKVRIPVSGTFIAHSLAIAAEFSEALDKLSEKWNLVEYGDRGALLET